MPEPRALFAVDLEEDPDVAADLVFDAIDSLGVDDSDWEWIIWERGDLTYIVVSAPLLVKGAVAAIKDVQLHSFGAISRRLEDNRNVWVDPRPRGGKTALEIARERIGKWVKLQYVNTRPESETISEEEFKPAGVPKQRRKIAGRAEVMARGPRSAAQRSQQTAENTAKVLGLDDGSGTKRKRDRGGFTFIEDPEVTEHEGL